MSAQKKIFEDTAVEAVFEDAASDAVEGAFENATADEKVAAKGNPAEQTVFGAAAMNAVKGNGEAGKEERGEGEDTMGANNAMMTMTTLMLLPSSPPPKCINQSMMTNQEDAAGNGGVGEGEKEIGKQGRSTMPMMMVTINRGVRMQQAIEQQYERQGKKEKTAGGKGA